MNLPYAERAVVDIKKLRDYSLSDEHEVGKHKARVFRCALGLTAADAEWLRELILRAALDREVVKSSPSPFGEKYVIDIPIVRDERSTVIRTAWLIELGTDFPRLTSCYVP